MVQETRRRLSRKVMERLRAMIREKHRFASEHDGGDAPRSLYLVTACCKIVEDGA
jgi:hypothetical protein